VNFASIVNSARKKLTSKNKSKKKEENIPYEENYLNNKIDYFVENFNDEDLLVEDNNTPIDFEKCM